MATEFAKRVQQVVGQIPRGRVASYGQVAALAGNPRGARGVGFILHNPALPAGLPCHRVIFRDGSLCAGEIFGGPGRQRQLLEEEGVRFLPDGRVDLAASSWLAAPSPRRAR